MKFTINLLKHIQFIIIISQLYGQTGDTIKSQKSYNKCIDTNNLIIFGLTINENNFNDIMNKLGQSNIVTDGHEEIICYCSNKIKDSTKLIFYRNDISDFVGFKLTLDSLEYNQCYKTDLISINTIIKSGLKLNLTKNKIRIILGEPTLKSINYWEYSLIRNLH